MTEETSAERIEMLALSLEIANQPETARILRRVTADRDAAIARAEAAERERGALVADITAALTTIAQEADARISAETQLEQAREALADLIGAADRMALAMNSGMTDAPIRRARATLAAIDKKEPKP